jgi:ABC-type sugar transport system, periplasmic component
MKRMHLKRTLSLLIAVLTMIPLSVGCGTEEETDTTSEVGNAVQEETEYVQTWESPDYSDFEMPGETNELVVYSDGTASFLAEAIGLFKKQYPEVNVVTKALGQDEYLTLIRTEIPAGSGPDFLVSIAKDLPDVYKTMVTGIFEDLNPYFTNDDEIDLSSFNEGVLSGGVMRERRYLVPIMYGLNTVITTEEALAENGISSADLLTFDRFCDSCAKFKENNPDSHLFSSGVTLGSSFDYLKEMTQSFAIEMIDYDRQAVALDHDAFQKAMDTVKLWYKKGRPDVNEGNESVLLARRYCLFNNRTSRDISMFLDMEVLKEKEETPLLVAIPDQFDGVTAQIMYYYAMPQASANKLNAWRFLKILLSEDIQLGNPQASSIWNVNTFLGLSVHNESVKKRLALIREKLPGEYNEFIPISAEETEAFYDITTRVTRSVLLPPILRTYLKDNMEPYLKKKAEYDDCFNDLLNVLKLYKDE